MCHWNVRLFPSKQPQGPPIALDGEIQSERPENGIDAKKIFFLILRMFTLSNPFWVIFCLIGLLCKFELSEHSASLCSNSLTEQHSRQPLIACLPRSSVWLEICLHTAKSPNLLLAFSYLLSNHMVLSTFLKRTDFLCRRRDEHTLCRSPSSC